MSVPEDTTHPLACEWRYPALVTFMCLRSAAASSNPHQSDVRRFAFVLRSNLRLGTTLTASAGSISFSGALDGDTSTYSLSTERLETCNNVPRLSLALCVRAAT
jgi:hypothetical protein